MNYYSLPEMVINELRASVASNGIHRLKPQTLYYVYFDLVVLNLAYFFLAYFQVIELDSTLQLVTFFLGLSATWLLAAYMQHNYPFWGRRTFFQTTSRLTATLLSHAALLMAMCYLFLNSQITYQPVLQATFMLLVALTAARPLLNYIIKKSTQPFRYVVIGGKSTNIAAIRKVFYKAYAGKAICAGRFGNRPIKKVLNLGLQDDITYYLQLSDNIQRVVYVDSDLSNKEIQNLIKLCTSKFIDFIIVPRESDLLSKRHRIENYYDLPILTKQKERIAQLHYQVLKRLFDIVFSALVIVFILSWMIPVIGILIKLESKGPVFFVQRRTGYFNNSFPCIKFRSMTINEECNDKQATKSDARFTRTGAFIRRHNIDEFPQFINVLLGHMSVVGPRPHMIKHTRQYSRIISEFMIRHSVKPGITGWAQVNGHRGPTETVEQMRIRVEHDIWYIENWTFFLDFKCIFMTITNFLKGDENAF